MKRFRHFVFAALAFAGGVQAELVHRYVFSNSVADVVGGVAPKQVTVDGDYTEAPNYTNAAPPGAIGSATSMQVGMDKENKKSGFKLNSATTGITNDTGTISLWFKPDSYSVGSDKTYLMNAGLQDGFAVLVKADSYATAAVVKGGTNNNQYAAHDLDYTGALTNWHHVALTWNATAKTATVCLDGETASYSFPDGEWAPLDPVIGGFSVGANNANGVNSQFDGLIYDVQIYDTQLSAGEIATLRANPGSTIVSEPPNIIFMLTDDLGYGDLSCYNPSANGEAPNNTPISTPSINSLATDGVLLTDFHSAAPICSPSRRALLTARYPNRLGEWAEGYKSAPFGVEAAKEPTIGMWLKEAGYATACYGKWNIGEIVDVSWPGAHGFDDWLVIDHNTGYFQHQNDNADCHGQEMIFRTGGVRETSLRGKYLTDIFTDEALEFIEEKQDEPFFLYLPWSVPHNPLQSPSGDTNMAYNAGPAPGTPEGRAVYVEMVEYLDSRIEKILTKLDDLGLGTNTLIVFTSDNGGQTAGNNWPLKEMKQYLEEGGVRVPALMKWPGVLPAGTVCDQTSIMMDASVTVLSVADALKHVPPGRELDGVDLMPVLQGSESDTNRTFGWRRRDWGNNSNNLRQEAYRSNDWKYIRSYEFLGDGQWGTNYTEGLYDLDSDIGEATNLVSTETVTLDEMRAEFADWKTNTVDPDAEFLIWTADQLGSPDQARLDAYLPTALNAGGKNNIPNPSPLATGFDLYDFTWDDEMQGKVYETGNTNLVSDPVVSNGVMSITIQPGTAPTYPMLYRNGYIDTSRFQILKIRMRITGAAEPTLTAEALLRYDGWASGAGDIPFEAVSDGQWHEYAIDVTLSSSWDPWVRGGRIGLQFPHEASQTIIIDIDYMRLESSDGFYRLAIQPTAGQSFEVTYPSLVGRSNSLLYCDNLVSGHWAVVSGPQAGNGEEMTLNDPNVTNQHGFYQLIQE